MRVIFLQSTVDVEGSNEKLPAEQSKSTGMFGEYMKYNIIITIPTRV